MDLSKRRKKFCNGWTTTYNETVQRIQHQLDTVESLNITLNEEFGSKNIAKTIINISSKYENIEAIFNTMRNQKFHYNPQILNHYQPQQKNFSNKR